MPNYDSIAHSIRNYYERIQHSLYILIYYIFWVILTGAGFGLGGWISSYVSEAILNDWGNVLSYGTLGLIIALLQICAVRLARICCEAIHKLLNQFFNKSLTDLGNYRTDQDFLSQQSLGEITGPKFWAQFHITSCELVNYRSYISWLSTTVLGGMIGGRLSILASWNLNLAFDDGLDFLLIYGTLRGFLTGIMQWLIFRRCSSSQLKNYAVWWVIITAAAGGISFRIGVSLIMQLRIWTPTVTGLIYGALTGLGLLTWIYGNTKSRLRIQN